jgi:hypothetical protein
VICERNTVVVIENGWSATLTAADDLMLNKTSAAKRDLVSTKADPVLLEIFNNLFMSIAEQMGVTLANTASSVNIKERLDFSCALFDARGQLIANAPHMPVHLGSWANRCRRSCGAAAATISRATPLPERARTRAAPLARRHRRSCPVFLGGREALRFSSQRAASRRHRRYHARLDALGLEDDRPGRRAHRQHPHRRSRRVQ